ncbi:MAG TPA: GNAT family N-acetyltransferase [Gaiellaceae bacterium]|nr:GNAT family N-acetyltransferase [Gaiellaceae bacterium]
MVALDAREDVVLRDGSTLRLRPTTPADEEALLELFSRLSPESRYLRFQGSVGVGAQLVAPFLRSDGNEMLSLIGELTGDDGAVRVIGLGTFIRLRDRSRAEVAFVVADEFQRRGIASRLLERLAAHARAAGIERFVAQVLPENAAMLRVFGDTGFEVRRRYVGGVVEVEFALATSAEVLDRMAERDHSAVAASLNWFFNPRTVAVIGASARRGTIGGELFRNVITADFSGAAYPVNPKGDPVGGVPGYQSVETIPALVDLAVICVPGDQVLDAAQSALRAGVRALCVISAGFAETGSEGLARQEQLLSLVRAYGARLIGPNCLGVASTSCRLNATFARRAFPPGRAAFSSQSGALGLALLEQADARGLGLSAFVSIGNKADVSSNDLLEYWEDDPETDVVLLYLESFGNPRKFARVAGRVARSKPILAMRSGTSNAGARAAASHTAALAGSDAVVDALFRQAGVLRASTLQQLLDTAVLLTALPATAGNRVAVLTNAGGLGILCADACEAQGLVLPELAPETRSALAEATPPEASLANPIDLLGSANAATYERVLPPILADPNIDAAIVLFVPPVVEDPRAVEDVLVRFARESEKPLLSVVMSADGTGHGGFEYPESAAYALGLAAQRAAWLRRPAGTVPDVAVDAASARTIVDAAPEGWLGPEDAHDLLAAYGIPLVGERRAATPDEAAAAAEELGLPVVVKTAAAGTHKTETGGVALDLRTTAEVREAATRMGGPVIVQQYVTEGAELLAGLVQDPVFGPLVAFGPGGVLAELIGSANFALAPLTDVDARELVGTGKAAKLVDGWRGASAADRGALTDLLHRLSRLAVDVPEVAELDLNPVLAGPDGCVAVDMRIRLGRPSPARSPKTW